MSGTSFVKILIKAPNQLVDDQTVHCERNWTVKKLKDHLANVYPCKPHPDGQKLIYSGQLLSDEAVLSDVLRSYDGLENNTIHLVCSLRDSKKMTSQNAKHNSQSGFRNLLHQNNTDWRGDSFSAENTHVGNTTSMVFSHINNNPQTIAQQNLLLQQAYMNYMAHFSQMYFMANRMGTIDNRNNPTTSVNESSTFRNNREPQANERAEDEGEDGREELRANRDWLEWFYILSRLFILFTVVYFYSSPERFIMVIAMALILINIDVFRWRRGHNLVENQPRENEVDNASPNENAEQRNWITITWTFMKTFFLSLVPDNRDI
ncbi:unnamed protein product [Nezara viridula]|uniref:Ubiquitin-like domain-containing protein n=1 Tax=Nezara viridula TaxID=85310 RepID=A0A9P0E2A8_NEZVI|nr:unnamed protein product [Nezara viridula]